MKITEDVVVHGVMVTQLEAMLVKLYLASCWALTQFK